MSKEIVKWGNIQIDMGFIPTHKCIVIEHTRTKENIQIGTLGFTRLAKEFLKKRGYKVCKLIDKK